MRGRAAPAWVDGPFFRKIGIKGKGGSAEVFLSLRGQSGAAVVSLVPRGLDASSLEGTRKSIFSGKVLLSIMICATIIGWNRSEFAVQFKAAWQIYTLKSNKMDIVYFLECTKDIFYRFQGFGCPCLSIPAFPREKTIRGTRSFSDYYEEHSD